MTLQEMIKKMEEKGFTFVKKDQLGKLYKKATGEDLFKQKDHDKADENKSDDFESEFKKFFGGEDSKKEDSGKNAEKKDDKTNSKDSLKEMMKELLSELLPKTVDPEIEKLKSSIPESNLDVFNKLAEKYSAEELKEMVNDLGLDCPSNLGYNSALTQKKAKDESERLADSKMAKNLGLSSKDFLYSDDDGFDTFGQIFSTAVQESKYGGGGAIAKNVHDKLTEMFKEAE